VKNGLGSKMRKTRGASPDRPPARRATGAPGPAAPARQVVWVYAVAAGLGTDQLNGLTGVAGEPVRVVTEAGLAAVVGSVSGAVFGEMSLTSLLTDLTAIELTGRAHHEVIAAAAARGPVVPLRLAATYPDDATVRLLLAERNAELTEMLNAFTGMQEWGVKVYVAPWAEAGEDGWPSGAARAPDHAPGLEWRWVTAEAWVEKIGQALNTMAVATRRHPAPDPRLVDQAGWMALNGAYLVSSERSAEFAEIAKALTAEHDALQADVTGPWPPYSFADR